MKDNHDQSDTKARAQVHKRRKKRHRLCNNRFIVNQLRRVRNTEAWWPKHDTWIWIAGRDSAAWKMEGISHG